MDLRGYESLRQNAAWRDLSSRGRILAHGEDNARLLHAMSTNHVQGLADGEGCYAFFLNAQGRIQADAYLLRCGADFLMDCEASSAQTLYAHIDQFIIADDVVLEDLASSHFSIGLEGPNSLSVAEQAGLAVPAKALGVVAQAGGYIARINETGLEGLRVILPLAEREGLLLRLAGVDEASPEAWEIVRHEQGKPRFGVEILERHLVQETRLMKAVHFSKGCYLGQEIVERVRARGAVHKGLAVLSMTSTPPEAGAEVMRGEAKAGNVLSSVFSPAEERSVAFAMLSVEAISGEQPLVVHGFPAELRVSSAFGPGSGLA